jgi:hypothetical protein
MFCGILICMIFRPRDMQEYIFMFCIALEWRLYNCIVFENFMPSIVDLMVANVCLVTQLTRHQ